MELVGGGVDFLGEHGAELVVKGICLVAVICDYLAICLPMQSRLFALVNDQHCFGFVFRLYPMWLFR